jgi:hypothetical protein
MENEPFAVDGIDHRRLMRPVDLAPKPAHVHVHEVALWNKPILPHLSEEHFTRKYPALVTHHILEQAELSRQQINRAIASLGRAFDEIELKRSHVQFCLRGIDRTPRQGFNQCAQVDVSMTAQRIGEEAVADDSVDSLNAGGGEGFDHLVCNSACHDLLLRSPLVRLGLRTALAELSARQTNCSKPALRRADLRVFASAGAAATAARGNQKDGG